jgi:hypothetical protein
MSTHTMNRISFAWKETIPLASELLQPIDKLSTESVFPQSGLNSITLWRADGSGIKIFNEMHDVTERLEVGVLNFERVIALPKYECISETIDLDTGFQNELKVFKLVIEESGILAESGIEIMTLGGAKIVIVASGFPCNLEVQGVKVAAVLRGPEYPLNEYQRELLVQPLSSFSESSGV